MSIKQIRLSAQAREQLIRLKTRTGIAPVEHPVPLGLLPVAAAADAADADRDPGRQQRRDDLAGLRRRGPRAVPGPAQGALRSATGWARRTRCWLGSSACTCTAASATWRRRTRSARSPTWCGWQPKNRARDEWVARGGRWRTSSARSSRQGARPLHFFSRFQTVSVCPEPAAHLKSFGRSLPAGAKQTR